MIKRILDKFLKLFLLKRKKKRAGVYTTEFDMSFFPFVRNVVAQTVALDLVPVQPLESLSVSIDYYGYDPPNLYRRKLLIEKIKKVNEEECFGNRRIYQIDVANIDGHEVYGIIQQWRQLIQL